MKKLFVLGLLIIVLIPFPVAAEQKPKIFVSVFPLYDVVNLIGGEVVEVEQVVPRGVDAHGYEPSPRKVADLEGASIFFYIGLGMEPWVEKAVSNLGRASVPVVKVSDVVSLRKFDNDHDHDHHDSDHGHHHHHGVYDPHIWLDPMNMVEVGELIRDTLIDFDSSHKELFEENFDRYKEKIIELDRAFEEGLAERKSDYILTSHAAFGYLVDRYGLKQISVSGISPHAEPSPHALAKLVEKVKEHDIRYIFLETLAAPRTAEVLAKEADLEILKLNPVEGLTREELEQGEDFFSLMEENLKNLRKALVY